MKISVALAAYKGERYIGQQLESILSQLDEDGEIIVSDDSPDDATRKAVEEYARTDKRIKYIVNEKRGVVKNFENALGACSGDVIFLCDQDDVWRPDKIKKTVAEIEKGADLVLHDASVTDASLNITEPSYFAVHGVSTAFLPTLIKNTYVGCCMAMTKELCRACLPFSEKTPMHDWLIALVAMKKGFKISVLNEPLILWRRHGDNVTGKKTSVSDKIKWRLDILSEVIKK